MFDEMEAEVSPTVVAWNWIIEYLAESRNLDYRTLAGLISSVPGILKGTSSGDAARERIALRFLEECTGYIEDNATVTSPSDEERIDISESCQDVFCRFLRKDLHGVVILNDQAKMNGIRNFIIRKRAALPKLSLITLKEVHDAGECTVGGIKLVQRDMQNIVSEAEDARECTPVGGNELVQRDMQNIVSEAEDSRECTQVGGDLFVQRDVQNTVSGSEGAPEYALVGGNGFVQRDEQNIVSASHESQHREVMKSAKDKPKESSVNIVNGPVLPNNSSMLKRNLIETALVDHEDLFSGNGNSAHPERQATASKSPEHNNTNGHLDEYANDIKKNLFSLNIQVPHFDGHGKVSDAPTSIEDGSLFEQLILDAQKKFLLAEKSKLIHVQVNEDGTENNLCIKCHEGGQLLSCVEDDCQITIHESCLGSNNCFDDKGEFRCLFCSCIQAAISYHYAKEKLRIAWETVSSFLNFDPIKRSLQEPISLKNPCNLEKLDGKSHGDKDFSSIDGNIPENAIGDMQCINGQEEMLQQRLDAINSGGLENANNADNNNFLTGGDNNYDGQFMGCERNQVENDIADNSPDNDNDKKSTKTDNQKYPIDSQYKVQEQVATSCSDHTILEELQSEEFSTRKRKKEVCIPKDAKSSKHKASKSYAKRYSNSVFPFGRRNKLPWTIEEEEALKDAVQKFHQSSKGVFPWTKILEHGRPVFHRTRQPMDLKDKWRNIQKRERALGK